MKPLLEKLAETKVVKVTGSFADGTFHSGSDIDFYVKPDHPDWQLKGHKRNITKVLEVLNQFGIKMKSDCAGYIHSHNNGNELKRQIEFSDLFERRKGKFPEVEIEGVIFKTY